jgi:hypothetical protein
MNVPSEDIRHILEAGLDDSESSGTGLGLVFGTNLFINREPTKPINCVTIFDTSGFAPDLDMGGASGYERPSIQIRVRNAKESIAWTLIEGIKNSLHGRHQQTWNGTLYSVIYAVSSPALLDWDDNENCRLVCNFNIQRRAV